MSYDVYWVKNRAEKIAYFEHPTHKVILIGGGEMIVRLAVFDITSSCKTRHSVIANACWHTFYFLVNTK